MSVAEILEELAQLSSEEQDLVRERLDQLQSEQFEETPEILSAIDKGIHSAETEPAYTVEQVQSEMRSWFIKSS